MRSGLGRSIHPSHATVRVAAGLTMLSGCVAGAATLLAGHGLGDAVQNGIAAGGSAFIAWAITREIAPDHPLTAAASGLLAPLFVVAGPADLLAAGVLILPVRIVAGTTGRDLAPVDLVVLGLAAAALSWRDAGVAVALATALAPAASAWWWRSSRRRLVLSSAAMVAVVVVLSFVVDHDPFTIATGFERGLFVAGLAAGLVTVWIVPPVSSSTDSRRGGRIITQRVRLARLTLLFTTVGAALWAGGAGVLALGPGWAALGVTAVSSVATLGSDIQPEPAQPPTISS